MKDSTIITMACFGIIIALSFLMLSDQQEKERRQNVSLKMDRIYRYCKESPICNKLDEEFTKFTSGIAVGRFE